MHVIVTGASGFLGSAIVRRLSGTGHTVVPVARRRAPGIVQLADYADAPSGDVLVHLAESARRTTEPQGADTYEERASATLDALLAKAYARVIYASSAVLYGDRAAAPHTPRDPVEATDAYTRIKRRGERVVLNHRSGVVARLTNVFGPGMSAENVVSTILRQIPGLGPLHVRDTRPVRDFLWIDDAADAIVRMVDGSAAGIFNVATGQGHSVGAVAALALEIAGEANRPVVATHPAKGTSQLVLDIADTVSTWAWSPATALREGLATLLKAKNHTDA